MFARILATGDVIIHTPDALVHHRHRVDEAGLDKQIRGNGSGMAALLTKAIIDKPSVLGTLIGRVPGILNRIKPGGARVAGTDEDVPGSLTTSEIKGFLEGPFLYLSSRKRNRLGAPRQAEQTDASGSATPSSSVEEAQASSATETTGEGNGHA